jgi:hypothetical protein
MTEPRCYAAYMAEQAAARGDTAQVTYWTRIKNLVDQAPPLTNEQAAQIRSLLRPALQALHDQRDV